MITSKLTSKAQTTIPREVRKTLRLNAGDDVVYELHPDHAVIRKAEMQPDDPFTTFREWDSEHDRRAYANL